MSFRLLLGGLEPGGGRVKREGRRGRERGEEGGRGEKVVGFKGYIHHSNALSSPSLHVLADSSRGRNRSWKGEESRERSNPLPSPSLPYSIQDTRAYRGMGPNDRSNQPREKRGVENREEKKKKEGKGRGQSSFASFTETNEQKTTLELSEINPAIRANWICRKEELERHSRNENIICNFRLQLITNASF